MKILENSKIFITVRVFRVFRVRVGSGRVGSGRGLKIVGSGRAPDLDPRVGSGRKFPTRFPAWVRYGVQIKSKIVPDVSQSSERAMGTWRTGTRQV